MQQLVKQFGDERRTIIEHDGQAHTPVTEVASLHEREPLVIAYTRGETIKALPADVYAPRGKNGNAVYSSVRGDEQLRQVIAATSQDYVLCACSTGRIFQVAAHRIPEGTRPARGEPVRRLLKLAQGEEVVALDAATSHAPRFCARLLARYAYPAGSRIGTTQPDVG